jgi:hypothetical protein
MVNRERAERWASIAAMAIAALLVVGAVGRSGIAVAGAMVALAFVMGVIAQRV